MMREMGGSPVALALIISLGIAAACGGRATSDGPSTNGAAGASNATSVIGGAGSLLDSSGAPNGGAPAPARAGGGSGGNSASPEAGSNVGGALSNGGDIGEAGFGTAGDASDACSNTAWTASASVLCAPQGEDCPGWPTQPQTAAQAIDGDPNTRYTTGRAQAGDEEFVVTFPATVTLAGITLTSVTFGDNGDDGPAMYAVEYSVDGATFAPFDPPLVGSGSEALPIPNTGGLGGSNELSIPFPPTTMKAVKVKQTGTKGLWWSIRELSVRACHVD
jgi:hypothetical protein